MQYLKKKKRRFVNVSVMALMIAILLCSCNKKVEEAPGKEKGKQAKEQEFAEFIKQKYGIASNPIFGRKTAHTEKQVGQTTTTSKTRITENSKGGSILYKKMDSEKKTDEYVCIYVAECGDNGIFLYADYIRKKDGASTNTYTVTLSEPQKNKCCYAIVGDEYLAGISIRDEKDEIFDRWIHRETVSVYKYTDNGLDEQYTIERKLELGDDSELKEFEIESKSGVSVYASGYGSYSSGRAEYIYTQGEFCAKANQLLEDASLDCIKLNKTSWNNRWHGMSIDESGIGKNMVKLDYSYEEPIVDENGDEVTDITIEVNKEKQQLEEGNLEEIEDNPVTYNQANETIPQEPIMVPENLPKSINKDDLQDLRGFAIDGFWHSADSRYVYHIYTQNPDNGFGTLYFADLEGEDKAKHGQVKQTSSYSVILKAMEDDGFSPEVFAVNNQLVSDEITLMKAEDWIASNLIGKWSDGRKTYTFKSGGTYEVKNSKDWYWGQYFIIDENKIVLGEQLDDLEVYDYTVEGNSFTLEERTFVRQ